jgi:hypothetical protein
MSLVVEACKISRAGKPALAPPFAHLLLGSVIRPIGAIEGIAI